MGGFKSSLTEKSVLHFIKRRDHKIKVTHVQIFRNYKYDTASVKLNVEDDENAQVLDYPYFWPKGLRCKPWVSHNKYKGNSHTQSRPTKATVQSNGQKNHDKSRQGRNSYGNNGNEYMAYSSMLHNFNPYLCLDNA